MDILQELLMQCDQYDRTISEIDGTIKSKAAKIQEKNLKIDVLNKEKDENLLKKAILFEACKKMRETSADVLADICTQGVQTIMGDNVYVKIIHGERGGVPTADFKLCSDYDGYHTEVSPTSDEAGGGVADIVSLSNFLAMNILHRDENTAVILLDEPTKYVSQGNADRVGQFIKDIATQFDKQIIMVTHASDTAKYADKQFCVALDNGKSIVSEE